MLPPRWYPPSRPQSIAEVLDTGFKIFQATLLPCLPYGVIWVVVGQLATLHDLATGRPSHAFADDPIWWLWYAIGIVLMLIVWSSLILRQSALASGRASSIAAELRGLLGRLPQLVALVPIAVAAIAVGFALLVLPGLYLALAFVFAVPALLVGGLGPLEALRYSARLLQGRFWRTTLILSIALVLMLALYTVLVVLATVSLLAFTFGGAADVAVVTAVSWAAAIALGAVGAPFGCAILLATFGELRVRREGLDLERRIAAAES